MQQDRTLISELLAIDEMEEVILTKEELTALTGEKRKKKFRE
jgi:hypothetical protein